MCVPRWGWRRSGSRQVGHRERQNAAGLAILYEENEMKFTALPVGLELEIYGRINLMIPLPDALQPSHNGDVLECAARVLAAFDVAAQAVLCDRQQHIRRFGGHVGDPDL